MKLFTYLLSALFMVSLLSSCKKDETSAEDIAKANEFKASLLGKRYQVKEYYSDKPIDYITDDEEVKQETNLWEYVSLWIRDDYNMFDFTTNQVTVSQNEIKIDGNTNAEILKPVAIGADKDGVYFDFLNYQYNPLRYRLVEFTSQYFVVYTGWTGGSSVFTKFEVIP